MNEWTPSEEWSIFSRYPGEPELLRNSLATPLNIYALIVLLINVRAPPGLQTGIRVGQSYFGKVRTLQFINDSNLAV